MEFQGALFAVRSMAVSRSFYETVLGRKVALDFGANLVFEGGPTLQEGFSALAGFPEERTVYRAIMRSSTLKARTSTEMRPV